MARVRRRSKTTPRVKGGRVQRKNHRDVEFGPLGPLTVRFEVPGPGYRHVVTREPLEGFIALVPDWDRASRGLAEIVFAEGDEWTDGWYFDGTIAVTAWSDPLAITVGPHYYAQHRAIWARLRVPQRPAPEFLGTVPGFIDDDGRLYDPLQKLLWDRLEVYLLSVRKDGAGQWAIIDDDVMPGVQLAEVVEIEGELHVYEACVQMRFDRRTAAAHQLHHVFLHELGHHVDAMARPHPGFTVRGEDYAEGWAERCAEQIWDEALALITLGGRSS